jgi:cyclopropane fatty-acyl-phospholipid synthase-like methyltransferase
MKDVPNLDQVKEYFDKRIQENGASARGSDWNSEVSQNARFDQLLKVIEGSGPFSLLDYGSGWGALADYLAGKGYTADYYGYDLLESAIAQARRVHAGKPGRTFTTDEASLPVCDYVVASGIFNFSGAQSFKDWTEYIVSVLDRFQALSRKGFASNFLTKYSDPERMRPDLYYADPLYLFDHCKHHYARNVALLHDYHLYDFTLIVRKD